MSDSPTPLQRHAVQEYVKKRGWCAVAYRHDFFGAMAELNRLSRKDENKGKLYRVRAEQVQAVA